MTKPEVAKKYFLKTAISYLGHPYKWCGDDPSGFDCSGFVLECLKSIGIVKENDDFTADSLMRYLLAHTSINQYQIRNIDTPEPGALLFLLNNSKQANHVVICLDEYFQIGASGGSSEVISEPIAWKENAYVKIRPIFRKEKLICTISIF